MIWQRICVLIISLILWPAFANATTHKHSTKHHTKHASKHTTKHVSKHTKKHASKHSTKKSTKSKSKHATKKTPVTSKPQAAVHLPDKKLAGQQNSHIDAQRADFKRAEKALKSKQLSLYYSIAPTLKKYPLYPYLKFAEFQKTGYAQHDVDEFLRTESNSPLGDDLRKMWLDHLGDTQSWVSYLDYYVDYNDTKFLCYQLRARLATEPGSKAEVFKKVRELWLYEKSQPPTCNPLFDQLESQNGITESLAWQRIELAARSHQRGLVHHLSKFVDQRDRPLIDCWLDIDGNPYKILNVDFKQYHHDFKETIMALALEQLANQNLNKARKVFQELQNKYQLKASTLARINRYFGLQLAYHYDPDAIHYLGQIPAKLADEDVHSWRTRIALRQQDWGTALHWISEMPEPLRQKTIWEYWEARGLKATGEEESATHLLETVAQERDFYGVLAASSTHVRNPYEPKSTHISDEVRDEVAENPGILRARELYILNRNDDARREWEYAMRNFDDAHIKAAAQLAHDWAWYDRSIITATKSQTPVDLNIRFPLVHREPLLQNAKQHDIDPAWAFAIVQQESLFITRARSPVGAIGLMQLMPTTAQSLSKEMGRHHPSQEDLWRPDNNINLGTAYLSKMYRLFGDNSVLATAAYNAGPTRVRQWLPRSHAIPSDIWIETIPFKETRTYVKNVVTYSTLYDLQLGRKPSLDSRLTDIRANQPSIELEKPF